VAADRRAYGAGPYLQAVRRAGPLARSPRAPLLPDLPWSNHTEFDLSVPVTFFVGENGTGKSTMLEAIAVAAGFDVEGGPLSTELTGLRARPKLAEEPDHWIVELTAHKPRSGFFLRAESFFNVARAVDELDLEGVYGGTRLHEQSHGESFVALAANRPARPARRAHPRVRRRADRTRGLRRRGTGPAPAQLPRSARAISPAPPVGARETITRARGGCGA